MASTLLTPSLIAKEGLLQLDNNLVAAKTVHRAFEGEFGEAKIGDTITVRKPVKYALRTGAVAQVQDATEGKVQIVVDTQRGVDLRFPTKDLTLTIDRFAERYLKHPMIALANQVDLDILSLYKTVWNWVGTPGQTLSGYKSFIKAPLRLDEMSVPGPRTACLSPADFYGMASSFTGLYTSDIAKTALEKSKLPMVGNTDCYASQNVISHTVGNFGGTPVISSQANSSGATDYATAKDTNQSTIKIDGLSAGSVLNAGDVISIANVFDVNPVTKQVMPYLQQFVVANRVTATGTGDAVTISPAIITSGQYQTVTAAPSAGAAITVMGTASTAYPQNLVFHENAFALCMVPMELPEGAVKKARQSYNGLSIRVICDYDIINDVNVWRLDILYGVKAIYPDLATRLSGSTG
jgi:hypothetical protein